MKTQPIDPLFLRNVELEVSKKVNTRITGMCRGLLCLWELQHAIFKAWQYKCRVACFVCQCPDVLENGVLSTEMLLRACVNAFFFVLVKCCLAVYSGEGQQRQQQRHQSFSSGTMTTNRHTNSNPETHASTERNDYYSYNTEGMAQAHGRLTPQSQR